MAVTDTTLPPVAPWQGLRFVVSWTGSIETDGTVEDVREHLHDLMEVLDDLRADGPAIHLNAKERSLTVFVEVGGDSDEKALHEAKSILLQAIQKAGGSAPDWTDGEDSSSWRVRILSTTLASIAATAA